MLDLLFVGLQKAYCRALTLQQVQRTLPFPASQHGFQRAFQKELTNPFL